MKTGKDVLGSVIKTAQMGQLGIEAVLEYTRQPALQEALRSQKQEYNAIEKEAVKIAKERQWEIKNLNPAVKQMAMMTTRMRVQGKDPDATIAAMMIQGNTRGSIKTLKNLHRYPESTGRICAISQRLLDCETDNIVQMQGFV
ncbi:MAG: hypothetical protein E7435_06095 [Ruminococcaceae bacterium]|nr:hypothetical protein [Oscillospiraceae bacterium]